ncbi:hypothetical protein N185_23485 [Sinorhizobium sp. GW3]|nr:hypothetical protein N185_23485 [Sinorhizobium sp. GW3]
MQQRHAEGADIDDLAGLIKRFQRWNRTAPIAKLAAQIVLDDQRLVVGMWDIMQSCR